jgi:hypothetical protein
MQIVIALVVGAAVGGLLHFLQTGRIYRGVALPPILGAFIGGLVWMSLTWVGWTTENPLLWLISFAAPAAVVPLVLIGLTRSRHAHDAREQVRLGIA